MDIKAMKTALRKQYRSLRAAIPADEKQQRQRNIGYELLESGKLRRQRVNAHPAEHGH